MGETENVNIIIAIKYQDMPSSKKKAATMSLLPTDYNSSSSNILYRVVYKINCDKSPEQKLLGSEENFSR